MSIYTPAEDSFLLQQELNKVLLSYKKSIHILDMGSGSGILAQTCIDKGFKNVIAVDINPSAIIHVKKNKIQAIESNLFSRIKEKFDLIIFNPPYLPFDKREDSNTRLQTTAGKKGYELILKFLKQAKNHLKKEGKILLLFSSLSKPKIILKKTKELEYDYKMLAEQKLFFEAIFVYQLTSNHN